LNASVCDGAHFATVETLPALAVKLFDKRNDVARVDKVDERVTHVAPILKVNGQVEKVIRALVVHVDFVQQHLLIVLVGDVANL